MASSLSNKVDEAPRFKLGELLRPRVNHNGVDGGIDGLQMSL